MLRLRSDLVLVKLAPPVLTTAGGLILAPAFDPPVCYGKVVDIGADVADVARGDVVAFGASVGDPIQEPYFLVPHLLIPEAAIDAVIVTRSEPAAV